MKDTDTIIYVLRGGKGNPNTASYNRFQAIIKMISMYYSVSIIGFKEQTKEINNKYLYAISSRIRYIVSMLKTPRPKRSQKVAVLLLGINPFTSLIIFIIARLKGMFVLGEINEYPIHLRNNNKRKMFFYNAFIIWWRSKIFDARFIMTSELISFYEPYSRKNSIIRKLPMTVDFDRFINEKREEHSRYIFYAGSFSQSKDGILSLINAYSIFQKIFPDIELWIAGNGNTHQNIRINELISELGVTEKVRLLGVILRDEIPGYMLNASVLVLPRPASLQASGGFPTKLGEYLTTGVPALITDVGENAKYVKDGVHLFFAPPGDAEAYAAKLGMILSNYSEALKVARQGQKFIYNNFSHIATSRKLLAFISDLNQRVKSTKNA